MTTNATSVITHHLSSHLISMIEARVSGIANLPPSRFRRLAEIRLTEAQAILYVERLTQGFPLLSAKKGIRKEGLALATAYLSVTGSPNWALSTLRRLQRELLTFKGSVGILERTQQS
jgi:hypothetical protein